MKEQFVTYEIALKLKELGFNEPCFGYFERKNNNRIWFEMPNKGVDGIPVDDVLAPLWQQAIDWLREKHGLYLEIQVGFTEHFFIFRNRGYEYSNELFCIENEDYEEGREHAILKAIELVKNHENCK